MARRLKIAVKDHRGESRFLTGALRAAGHEFITDMSQGTADVLLIDFDIPGYQYGPVIEHFHEHGAKLIMYPHGAGAATLSYDALFDPDPRFAANLVTGVGQVEVLRRLEYPVPMHAIGFYQAERRAFRPSADVKRVVFAPTHPNGDGSLIAERREMNTKVFESLLKGGWDLTVRHIGTLEQNGLREADGVTFVNGRGRPLFAEMDAADVVVAGDGTYPTMAIVRGVPTVMYSQHRPAWGLPGEEQVIPRRLALYEDYNRFPFDVEDGPLDEVLSAAARSEEPIAHWKRRFLGEPFDALAAVSLIERVAEGPPTPTQIDPTRAYTTLGWVDELVERPELLRGYAERFGPQDDASLMLCAPGLDANQLLRLAEQAVAGAGIDDHRLPDVLLTPVVGSPEAYAALADRADTVLSDWPAVGPIGTLPRFDAAAVS